MPQIDPGLFQLFVLGLLVVGILVLGSTLLTMSRLKDVLRSKSQPAPPEAPTEDRKAQRDAIRERAREEKTSRAVRGQTEQTRAAVDAARREREREEAA